MDVETPVRFEAVPVTTPADGPLAVELVPAPDPWDVARRLAHLSRLLFLDSAERSGERGRYLDVIADSSVTLHYTNTSRHAQSRISDYLSTLDKLRNEAIKGFPPFLGV